MSNEYGVHAVGHKLLVKPNLVDTEITEGALKGFKYQGQEIQRERSGTETGTIVDIGPMAWRAYDGNQPDWAPWAKVGDEIYFARHAGRFIEYEEDKWLLVILDDDVQLVIDKGDEDAEE